MRRVLYIILTILITLTFIAFGLVIFGNSYIRLMEGCRDLGLSFAHYFCEIFNIKSNISPTVNNKPSSIFKYLPKMFEGPLILENGWVEVTFNHQEYFELLFSKQNLMGWAIHSLYKLKDCITILAIIIPFIICFVLIIRSLYMRNNTKHGIDTIPLKIHKKISKYTYQPIKRFVIGYIDFVNTHKEIKIVWLLIWLVNFNLITIILEFLAYYFWLAIKFDFSTITFQLWKLIKDLRTPFRFFPYQLLLPVALYMFNKFRIKRADGKLRHFEARNCGFINELPIVSMSCGSMGKKKTTLITDMALSQEVMFRQKALEILQKTDLKFPYFPWICFEDELRACMRHNTVHNLATIKQWIQLKRSRFEKHFDANLQLYGYYIEKNGYTYNDALKVSLLWDCLEIYALAYFVYVIESSLIVSNYSIRTDNRFMDEGNFPMWAMDFFPEGIIEGRHAHIMDFDAFRLGKKVIEDNPNIGSFEFGVVVISEVGKERGNNLELKEVKKGTDEANQKNDLFNAWLKMCRHSATIDNFPFIKVFTDEQRPESWGADARDLCDIVHIVSSGELRLALPFYTIEDMLAEWSFNRFMNLYYWFRYRRGDNTLLVHCLKSVTAWLWKRNVRIYNKYGFSVLKIEKERGTMNNKPEKKKYFLMNKKIYSRRFSTDCFSDYFNDLAGKANVGIGDYLEYATEKATVEELKQQNSYFINSLYK